MSVITNFKKRQQIKEKQKNQLSETSSETTAVKANEALTLLAKLLNVPEENAIAEAIDLVEQRVHFVEVNVDLASDEDKTVTANVEIDDELEAVKDELVADIENSADAVQSAASNVESSAEKASDVTDNLAYTADDISAATDELKEATAEIKKPSAVQKSSSSKKTN